MPVCRMPQHVRVRRRSAAERRLLLRARVHLRPGLPVRTALRLCPPGQVS